MVTLGRAERLPNRTTLDDPMSATLSEEERLRYSYPQIRVIPPGGPYFKFPWQDVRKISVAIQTVSIGYDPESPKANQSGEVLEAVTKDQLNTGLRGQMRFSVSEKNLYAFMFGVKNPVAHVMGYFISILRERIAVFEAQKRERLATAKVRSGNPTVGPTSEPKTVELPKGMFEEPDLAIARKAAGGGNTLS